MRKPIIEVKEISKDYGRNRILDSGAKHRIALSKVSFDIFEGDRVALIGSNGSGKSTLLAILSGMIKPTTGRVVVIVRVEILFYIGENFNQDIRVLF
jgi:ABC-type polysaccharide/polyol phosphate transport system ATPase subunit